MIRRTAAMVWNEVLGRDKVATPEETAGMITTDFVCPYCGLFNGCNIFFYSADKISAIDSKFQVTQICDGCSKPVIVECGDFNKGDDF